MRIRKAVWMMNDLHECECFTTAAFSLIQRCYWKAPQVQIVKIKTEAKEWFLRLFFCVVLELFLMMVFFSAMLLSPDRLFKECNLFAWNPVKVCVNFLLLNLSEWFGPILIICHCPSFITSDLSAKPIAALLKWDKHDSL